MSEKSWPNYVPGLNNMPKNIKKVNPPATVIILQEIDLIPSSILIPKDA